MERHDGGYSADGGSVPGGITRLTAVPTEVWRGNCLRSREALVLSEVGSP